MNKLILPTLRTFLLGATVLGILIFLPAWTLNYWQAWVFIIVFMTSVNAIGDTFPLKTPNFLSDEKTSGRQRNRTWCKRLSCLSPYSD